MPEQMNSETDLTPELKRRLDWKDALLLVAAVACVLFMSWFRSRNRIFWSDEIMGWLVLRQDTWAHLLRVWWGGIDSSGIFFYLLGRPWLSIFGATEVSLRMFSAFGIAISLVLTWIAARRYFSWRTVAVCVPFIFLVNRPLLWQLANGRTYGVLMTGIALLAYAFLRTDPGEPDSDGVWPTLLVFLGFMLVMGGHILGVIYCTAFFAGFAARDYFFRVFRPRIYLAGLLAGAILFLSWRNLLATAALGKPSFWTVVPSPVNLYYSLFACSFPGEKALLVVGGAFLASLYSRTKQQGRPPLFLRSRASLYFLLSTFLLLTLIMFAVSRVTTSIFVDRYLLPMVVGDAFLLCELASRLWQSLHLPRLFRIAVIGCAFLILPALYRRDLRAHDPFPMRDYTAALLKEIPGTDPVVITDPGVFAETVHYRNKERKMLTPIDGSIVLDPEFGPGGASGLHEMENWKTYGFYSNQILPTDQILATHRSFVVVSDPGHTLWMRRYILSNPKYSITAIPSFRLFSDMDLQIWQVEER